MRQKGFAPILLILIVLGFVFAILEVGNRWSERKYQEQKSRANLATSSTPASTPELSPSEYWANSYKDNKERTFTSSKLGISFKYLDGDIATEIGNKVYINNDNPPEEGQWVEVFSKNPSESLTEAIQSQILSKFPGSRCKVHIGPFSDFFGLDDIRDPNFTKRNYVFARIEFDPPLEEYPSDSDFLFKSKCPEVYTTFGGMAYFLMDPSHPNKYLFFSIGQYYIPAKTGPWQQTIEIIN